MTVREALDPTYEEMAQSQPMLSDWETKVLVRQVQRDYSERAMEKLLKANQGLVIQYARQFEGRGLPLDDLIQEGNIGLMQGIRKLDYSKSDSLGMYAGAWIAKRMRRAIEDQSRTVRLPAHVCEKLRTAKNAQEKLSQELRRYPSAAEVASFLGWEEPFVEMLLEPGFGKTTPLHLAEAKREVEGYADEGEGAEPEASLEGESMQDAIIEAWAALDDRHRDIVMRSVFLDENDEAIAHDSPENSITRRRVGKISKQGLCKILDHLLNLRGAPPTVDLQGCYVVRVSTDGKPERTVGYFCAPNATSETLTELFYVERRGWEKYRAPVSHAPDESKRRKYTLRRFPTGDAVVDIF